MSVIAIRPRSAAPNYRLAVDFSQAGGSIPLLREGFSGQEREFIWALGPRSRIVLPDVDSAAAACLVLNLSPCLADGLVTAQYFAVKVNGTDLGWQRITGPSHLRCHIPAGIIKTGRPIELVFEHPGFVRLDRLGVGADNRPLALRFFDLCLRPDTEDIEDGGIPAGAGGAVIDLLPYPMAPAASEQPPTYYNFAVGEPGNAYLADGWHTDETGLVWTTAPVSRLQLPPPEFGGPVTLRIGFSPLIVRSLMPRQRLAVVAAGLMLGQFQVGQESAIAVTLPAGALLPGERLEIALCTPDALRLRQFGVAEPDQALGIELAWISVESPPARARAAVGLRGDGVAEQPPTAVSKKFLGLSADELRAAIEADLGMTAGDLMRQFESLGEYCAFGFAQRAAGAEVLGLLRFANTPLRSLLRGLSDAFRAASQKSEIEMYLHPDIDAPEYRLRIARYGIRWHTMVKEPDAEAQTVLTQQLIRLGFLRRKFEEGLRVGRKIYTLVRAPLVVQMPIPGYDALPYAVKDRGRTHVLPAWDPPQTYEVVLDSLLAAEAQAVFLELNRFGANTILYFVLAAPGSPGGMVELLAPGLMRGTISSLFANDLDWVRVAANAWLLNRDANAAFRAKETG